MKKVVETWNPFRFKSVYIYKPSLRLAMGLFCCLQPVISRHILTGQNNEASVSNATTARRQSFSLASLGAYVPALTVLRPGPLRLSDMKLLLQVDPGDDSEFLDWLEATEPDQFRDVTEMVDPESALDFPELRR